MKSRQTVILSTLLLSLVAVGFLITQAPDVTAEAPDAPSAVISDSTVVVAPGDAELLPPQPTPQSHWRCNNLSFDTAIQCACNNGGLGTGGPSCSASLDGFRVRTEGSGDTCSAVAECDDGTKYSCFGSSTCEARIDTADGSGRVDCDGNRTTFTC